MIRTKTAWVLITSLTLAACAPLQQAPLIYSSKTTLGIDLSTPTSEQPGVTINIGFKQVDAAYVPVAVAKQCDTGKGAKDCENSIYQLKDVTAYNNSDDSKIPDNRVTEARNKVNQLISLIGYRDAAKSKYDDLAQKVSDDDAAVRKIADRQDYKEAKEASKQDPLTLTDAQNTLLGSYTSATALLQADQTKVGQAKTEYEKNQDELSKFIQDPTVKNLAANLKLIGSVDAKQDAYSVFGSFDGKAGADGHLDANGKPTGEATLVVGKVFSTGVASQFLTQGLRALYTGKGNSACIAQIAALRQDFAAGLDPNKTDEYKKKMSDFSSKLAAICSPIAAPDPVATN